MGVFPITFINDVNDILSMAMLDIEYRFSNAPLDTTKTRRKSVQIMESYMRDLVFEMQSADISVKFTTAVIADTEKNMVYINGKSVPEILDGLEIKIPMPEEEECDCNKQTPIPIGKPTFTWNKEHIEDIPDVLMKNAIAKVYADMNKNRIELNNIE